MNTDQLLKRCRAYLPYSHSESSFDWDSPQKYLRRIPLQKFEKYMVGIHPNEALDYEVYAGFYRGRVAYQPNNSRTLVVETLEGKRLASFEQPKRRSSHFYSFLLHNGDPF